MTNAKTYLVTAAHVIFDETSGNLRAGSATLFAYSPSLKEVGRNSLQVDLQTLSASKQIRRHSTEDIAIIHIGDITDQVVSFVAGVSVLEKTGSGIVAVQIQGVKQFKDILVGNTIYTFGYPTSIGIKNIPQIDPLYPLLRSGIIAGTNAARKTIILDCPSYYGNSGGPVLEVEEVGLAPKQFRVIGVVTEFVPFAETWVNITHKYQNLTITNSGYTVAVPMDPVLELINSP